MKAYIKTNPRNMAKQRNLPSDVRKRCVTVVEQMLNEQSDSISNRTANEIAAAMYQCNLSPKTINRVIKHWANTIIPWMDSERQNVNGDNTQQVRDSDMLMYNYLSGVGVEPVQINWRNTE